ncbi:hypothetical protein HK100_000227 [Physocladia obscura]|uniref:UspA domain-containing protein n=1 Tax=Physocladia obscura TaxID=109957 RepID=A0AAD5TAN2_9FUNG|nr:hypothetical protein HK100_000227 [Physocladia obscura]
MIERKTEVIIDDGLETCTRIIVCAILVILNVQPKSPLFVKPSDLDVSDLILTVEERLRSESHLLLGETAKKIRAVNPNIKIKAISLKGEVRDTALNEIEELKADCVVVGSRNLSKLRGSLLGSVSSFLVTHVKICPVIAVKPAE